MWTAKLEQNHHWKPHHQHSCFVNSILHCCQSIAAHADRSVMLGQTNLISSLANLIWSEKQIWFACRVNVALHAAQLPSRLLSLLLVLYWCNNPSDRDTPLQELWSLWASSKDVKLWQKLPFLNKGLLIGRWPKQPSNKWSGCKCWIFALCKLQMRSVTNAPDLIRKCEGRGFQLPDMQLGQSINPASTL